MRSLVFDTETTGLIRNSSVPLESQPRVIEFCGKLIEDDGTLIEELYFRCNPNCQIEAGAYRVHGIKLSSLTHLPDFKHHINSVQEILDKSEAIVAHNLKFDLTLLKFEFQRAEIELRLPERQICTVQETISLYGHRLNLQKLHEHLFKEGFDGGHQAQRDVDALIKCYVELRKRGDV